MVIPRAPLIPEDDPTTLFTGSGMQPLLPYLLGADHPAGHRLADSQTCLRVQDIDEVGDNRHTTFFEMLGNWSLGDYFKHEQLPQFWEFLTETGRAGPEPDLRHLLHRRRGRTASRKDTESAGDLDASCSPRPASRADQVELGTEEHGAEVGHQGARIAFYGKKNWWCRGGKAENMPVGEPGGPDSEVFYLYPQIEHDPAYGAHCHQNCDCGRFIELGNSVFMEYKRTETGFEPLPRKNVDYGGGLARIAAASMDSPDVFRINLLWPIIEKLQELSGKTLRGRDRARCGSSPTTCAARPSWPSTACGPSNKAQGYVMRRLIRRAVRYAFDLGLEQNFFPQIIPTDRRHVRRRLPRGRRARGDDVDGGAGQGGEGVPADPAQGHQAAAAATAGRASPARELFVLYDTFGFPVELSTEEAQPAGIAVSAQWREEFDEQMAAQRARSQQATKAAS